MKINSFEILKIKKPPLKNNFYIKINFAFLVNLKSLKFKANFFKLKKKFLPLLIDASGFSTFSPLIKFNFSLTCLFE